MTEQPEIINVGAVYAKLNKVLSKIRNVEKSGYNSYFKYNYVKEEDLAEMIRPLMAAEGLAITFNATDFRELKNDCIAVLVTITIGDDSGATVTCQAWGMGQDKGDKGIYKAMTGAVKYILFKSFLVSTGDDPEQHDKSQDTPKATEKAKTAPKPEEKQKVENTPDWAKKATSQTLEGMLSVEIVTTTKAADNKTWYTIVDTGGVKHLTNDDKIGGMAIESAGTGEVFNYTEYKSKKNNMILKTFARAVA